MVRNLQNKIFIPFPHVAHSGSSILLIHTAAEEEEELKKTAVVNWYLKEIESEIDSEEELINRKGLIEKVIHRLVHYVSSPFAHIYFYKR